MAVKFEYPPGSTPLDADDAAGLIPSHITTQGQLNEWEFQNVADGRVWAFSGKRKPLLTARFAQELHRRMFGRTWKWAGKLRKKETLPGIDPKDISVELKKLFDEVEYQLQHKSMPLDEIAARTAPPFNTRGRCRKSCCEGASKFRSWRSPLRARS